MARPAHVITFPVFRVNLYINNQHTSSPLNRCLHEEYTLITFRKYINLQYQWTAHTPRLIAWQVFFSTLKKQPTLQHQQLFKYIYWWLPTGQAVHHHNSLEDHRCPHCNMVQEHISHLLWCPHLIRATQQVRFLTVHLHNFYHTSNTAHTLHTFISQSLTQ
jgi:hypothetical protein